MRNLAAIAFAFSVACTGKSDSSAPKHAETHEEGATATVASNTQSEEPNGGSGKHRKQGAWKPGEFKRGKAKWRDAGVYVDGVPIGAMWYAELPRDLMPVWVEQVEGLDFKAGHEGPKTRTYLERRFRFSDYLTALGVNVGKIKEIHFYGGGGFAMVVSGKDFHRVKDSFQFNFGSINGGKPVLYPPAELKTNTSFDRAWAVVVYINKKPPSLRADGEVTLNDKPVYGIPYYGEPMRGGIRVYKDDRLALQLKRRKLVDEPGVADKAPDGTLTWNLFPFLKAHGIRTNDIVAAEVIRDEKRFERYTRADLETMTFTANPQASGKILLGGDKVRVKALSLYTRPIPNGPMARDILPKERQDLRTAIGD